MFLTTRKLHNRIREIESLRYRCVREFDPIYVKEDVSGLARPEVPADFSGWEQIKEGHRWSGRDLYLWLHMDMVIPKEWKGKRAVGLFDFGKTGGGNNSGFESLLYVDGQPFTGVDANHKEVFFKEEQYGEQVSLTFRLWSGLEGGGRPRLQEHEIKRAALGILDEAADDLYYLGDMVLRTVEELPENDPVGVELLKALDRAFLLLDWTEPGSDEFYASVEKADEALNKALEQMDKNSLVNVFCVGHTHIDTAWLWRLKHTREKASRSFSTVLRLMEQYPEYEFLQTQPQIYAYIKEDFPEIFEKIKERVKEGRWEPDGAMWVEADCNLTSGESLTRQILLGTKFFREEFGTEPHYLWLPDVFGYSWALPQILKKSGIDMFMTTKISWNQYNRMPHDTFWWEGIDGSSVLTHFITTPTPDAEPGSWFYTYNGELLPKTVKGVWDSYKDKEVNSDLLISYGYGDGGGGVNRDMLERRRRLDKIPGLPHVKTSTAGAYFEKLKENVKNSDRYVHVWDGELYLEYHRGTYTSQAYNKRMNRKMELFYRQAEWFTVLRGLLGKDLTAMEQEKLDEGWQQILTHQFHDIIPGSSIHEVYEDSRKNYAAIEQTAKEVVENFAQTAGLAKAEGQADVYTVFNDSGWNLGGLVLLPGQGADAAYTDVGGNVLESQNTAEGTYVRLSSVPAAGAAVIYKKPAEAAANSRAALSWQQETDGVSIETPWYSAQINGAGQITRLYDKENDREVFEKGSYGNVLQIFEDKPLGNDAWDIDIYYKEKPEEITQAAEYGVTECGSLRLVLSVKWKYHLSEIAQDIIFYANDRRIDFVTKVDYEESNKLLKAAFPVDIRSTYATYDVQYGNVRRPNHWNTSWDMARFESVAHRWVDLSERNYGVSLLNDCKYGHDVYKNTMRITLLKCATYPDYAADKGSHSFTYSLLPHRGDFVEGQTVQEAYRLNQPLTAFAGKAELPIQDSFVSFNNEQVELDAIKRSEDGKYLVVRFHEFAGARQRVRVTAGFEWKSWALSDLMERPLSDFSQNGIDLTVKPYEIITLLFEI